MSENLQSEILLRINDNIIKLSESSIKLEAILDRVSDTHDKIPTAMNGMENVIDTLNKTFPIMTENLVQRVENLQIGCQGVQKDKDLRQEKRERWFMGMIVFLVLSTFILMLIVLKSTGIVPNLVDIIKLVI